MGFTVVEKLEGEFDKVISIPGYQASLLFARKLKLLQIRRLNSTDLMGAQSVHPIFSEDIGDLRAEVFIEIEFHSGRLMKG
jgi:hypothetical protein